MRGHPDLYDEKSSEMPEDDDEGIEEEAKKAANEKIRETGMETTEEQDKKS